MRIRPISTALAALSLAAVLAGCSPSASDEVASAPSAGLTGAGQSQAESTPEGDAVAADDAASTGTESEAAPAAVVAGAAPAAPTEESAGKATAGQLPRDSATIAEGARTKRTGIGVPNSALADRDVIYTADLTVEVDDVAKAVSQVESAVAAAGGIIAASERSTESPEPRTAQDTRAPQLPRSTATMTLRIPPGDFTGVLERIGRLGLLLDRNLTGKDVTEAVVDVKSRIASARISLARIRELMDRATTLRDVVSLEGELSRRESDLEALLAKAARLSEATSLATVTVRLVTAQADDLELVAAENDEGFLAGLKDGWNAFTDAMVVAATVLGAVLPFALALLLLGPAMVWLTLRMRRMLAAATVRRENSAAATGA
ncbi:MAG: DUF4349 domain-containing protein [Sporichthyaceae bacterium]